MSDDIAFKIQLGIVLPKMDEKLSASLTTIIEQVFDCLEAGTLEGEDAPTMEEIKTLIMQDLEIFLDSKILPAIEAKRNPPEDVVDEAVEELGEAEDEGTEAEEPAE